jgi:hypothetical protein
MMLAIGAARRAADDARQQRHKERIRCARRYVMFR